MEPMAELELSKELIFVKGDKAAEHLNPHSSLCCAAPLTLLQLLPLCVGPRTPVNQAQNPEPFGLLHLPNLLLALSHLLLLSHSHCQPLSPFRSRTCPASTRFMRKEIFYFLSHTFLRVFHSTSAQFVHSFT